MIESSKAFNTVNKIPIHYSRLPNEGSRYGEKGYQRTFYSHPDLYPALESVANDLEDFLGLGKPKIIVSAGAYVEKAGWHGKGKAFDFDSIFWENKDFVTLKSFPLEPAFYLSVEAIMRKNFGLVLAYSYNLAHHDHFHCDLSRKIAYYQSSRTNNIFIQNVAKYIFDLDIEPDGVFGSRTNSCIDHMLVYFKLRNPDQAPSVNLNTHWKEFLSRVAMLGTHKESSRIDIAKDNIKTPLDLLHNVYEVIKDSKNNAGEIMGNYNNIEKTLNEFSNHPDSLKWLNIYRN